MRQREKNESVAEKQVKVKIHGRSERHFIAGEEGERIVFLEGSQASPANPSDEASMKVKTLEQK
jgi:hypothetical protein